MRTCITTFSTPSYKGLADITLPILKQYAAKHGYSFHSTIAEEGQVDYIKTKDAIELLNYFEIVFMVETDILIMNHNIKIESFIDKEHDFFICNDRNGVNFGSAIVKNTYGGKGLMNQIQSKQNEYKTEQNVLENYTDERICYLPHPSINSIDYNLYAPSYGVIGYKEGEKASIPTHEQGNYEHGDFACHLPGKTLEFRINYFNELKQHIVYE